MKKILDLFKTADGRNHIVTFLLISTLFLLWGFCNGMIDVMDKHFQDKLHLARAQSAWVQFAHYLGYFLIALPAGWLSRKLGYKGGILVGLAVVALGGFWFVPATFIDTFWAYLLGVCLLAMGLTFLETIANPYTTVLGPPETAATRINLAQSCNGIGWILGPWIGGAFFYGSGSVAENHERLYIPYLGVGIIVLLLFVVFAFAKIPDLQTVDAYHEGSGEKGAWKAIWKHWHFSGAVLSQFLYVAAQAGIFSFFINYIVADTPPVALGGAADWLLGGTKGIEVQSGGLAFINEVGAARLLSYGFALFLLGRFVGAFLMKSFAPHRVLGVFASVNVLLMVLIFLPLGWISVTALFLSFFFMSIMFPTIFALGIHGLGRNAKIASSFIVMAIMGGAIMPKLMGWVSDHYGQVEHHYGRIATAEAGAALNHNLMGPGFIVPLFCFVVLAAYAFAWKRLSGSAGTVPVSTSGEPVSAA